MSMLLAIKLAVAAVYVGLVFYAARAGRRRGRAEVLELATSLLADARQEGVDEGALLIRTVNVEHRCDNTGCALANQRQNASWQ